MAINVGSFRHLISLQERVVERDSAGNEHVAWQTQRQVYAAVTDVSALAITKLDGTAKGGVVIGISDQLKTPVRYIGLGEGMKDLQVFNNKAFVESLF